MSTWILEVSELSCGYDGSAVVHSLNLALAEGEIGCLLGPSGCGKSTVLRALAGFIPPMTGQIKLRGNVLSTRERLVAPENRGVGMVFQDYALFPHLSIAENIGFGLHRLSRQQRQQTVQEMLELISLQDMADCLPTNLSGGQQQRVALARAMAPSPDLILLDEPFSSLDADLRRRLSIDVRDLLKKRGLSAILVTHDQQEAFAMCDQIAVLRDGQMQQWDSPYNLYHEPANRFVASFVGQGCFVRGQMMSPDAIECELGVIRGNRAYGWARGTPVDFLVRPDDVVHDPRSDLQLRIVEKTFAGTSTIYRLQLASGAEIEALFRSHLDFQVDQYIGIRLEADHLIAFAARETHLAPGPARN
ncbi:MAG: iron ABC transporter ATP-binding protein [Alteromonadaceae bacterium]|nr:iron ABC transporter ATP-binding protein [Alteromonadaceae bacterium]